jgi:hypothetical protein
MPTIRDRVDPSMAAFHDVPLSDRRMISVAESINPRSIVLSFSLLITHIIR